MIPYKITWIPLLLLLAGCVQQEKWTYEETITIKQTNPLGIAGRDNQLWISAPEQKKVLRINKKGEILESFVGLQRPMHIHSDQDNIYIPIYLEDKIAVIDNNNKVDSLELELQPDAPGGVFVRGDTLVIADFYNHRVIFQTNNATTTFGEKGHDKGQLFYPTDVELSHNKIFVADAYNHRVQVYDLEGKPLKIFGANQKINVATGITVYDNQLFVTDFFNNRILIFDLEGNLVQTLSGHFNKPADTGVLDGDIYIPNFGDNTVIRYRKK